MRRLLVVCLLLLCVSAYAAEMFTARRRPPAAGLPAMVTCTTQTVTATGTPTYTQDITCPGAAGQTPKGAILLVSHATSNDTAVAEAKWSWFLTDGTRHRGLSIHSEDAAATSDEYYGISESGILQILTTGTGGTTGEATFNSLISGGIRLNWTESPGANYRIMAIFYFGADVSNVYVGHVTGSSSDGGTVDVTAPGFNPDVVFMLSAGSTQTETANGSGSNFAAGWSWDQATDVRRGMRWGCQDGQASPGICTVGMHNDSTGVADFGTGFELGAFDITGFDASGFTLTTVDANGGADEVLYMAINFAAGRDVWVGDWTTPTSSTSVSTAVGFIPQHLQLFCNYMTTIGGWDGGGAVDSTDAGSMTFGAGEMDSEFSASYVNEDDVPSTSDTYSYASTGILRLRNEADATALVTGDWTSRTATEFTLSYTVADATARKCIGFAIE